MTLAQQPESWPTRNRRLALQSKLAEKLADAIETIQSGIVAPATTPTEIRRVLDEFDFKVPITSEEATDRVLELLTKNNVHMMHPGYFGLFNPSILFPGALADQITAMINPQLAVWSHAPVAAEIESRTIAEVAELFGWSKSEVAGHFTSGGAEANYTAVLMALTRAFPEFAERGTQAIVGRPRLYVSAESHLAWLKIAHQAGIGRDAVVLVPTDGEGRLDAASLSDLVNRDRQAGDKPFFVGATAGTTNAGMIDPLASCRQVANHASLWFHVDAAWGGAAILSPRSAATLRGSETADSITLDAHKWFAVPMGAGMFLCRDNELLGKTFRVSASYMPDATEATTDPYTHSLQWSRRFIGLKLFLSLAVIGWSGYRAHVERTLELADALRDKLRVNSWRVVNDSPLAVLCFVDDNDLIDPDAIANHVVAGGRTWISATRFENDRVMRACITSHFTTEETLDILVDDLNAARLALRTGSSRPQ
jgi:aromatic-L-amino-acid decarboxylase